MKVIADIDIIIYEFNYNFNQFIDLFSPNIQLMSSNKSMIFLFPKYMRK